MDGYEDKTRLLSIGEIDNGGLDTVPPKWEHGKEDYIQKRIASVGEKRRERRLIYMCALCAFISYCDRINISVAIINMGDEFSWSYSDRAMVLGGFFYGYTCSQIVGAALSRKYGFKIVLAIAVVGWSLITMATPAIAKHSATAAVFWRVLLGLFEGVAFPVMFDAYGTHIPLESRSYAVAIISVGNGVGAVTAFALCPILITTFGWQAPFYIFGFIGFVWTVFWMLLIESGPGPIKSTIHETNQEPILQALVSIILNPAVFAITLAAFANNFGGFLLLAWLPSLMRDRFQVDGSSLWITCLPYVAYLLGAMLGGSLADKMVQAGRQQLYVRKVFLATGFILGSLSLVGFTMTNSSVVAIMLYCLERGAVMTASIGGYEANKLDVASPRRAGLIQAWVNSIASFAGAIAVPLAAFVVSVTGEWNSVMLLVVLSNWLKHSHLVKLMFLQAVIYILAVVVYWKLASCEIQIK
eukprot:m.95437 g.95437  ORF g.95437 m.95437 type:complete len:470 (-) comp13490_c0_seq1:249-1658(-)